MSILITSASGNIGGPLIELLLEEKDVRLVLPSSKADKLKRYHDDPRVSVEEGPISDPVCPTLVTPHRAELPLPKRWVDSLIDKQCVHDLVSPT